MHEADFYERRSLQSVQCHLCPHYCLIEEGDTGKCKVRTNKKGRLCSGSYGFPVSISVDPIEKKPLYHFFPGRDILSVGTPGCNFRCSFCQNYTISQSAVTDIPGLQYTPPGVIVEQAQRYGDNAGIAYTYNEPTVWYEYMYDIAVPAGQIGLKNVVVSNGYINPRPLEKLLEVVHAFNIDFKSFSDKFYREAAGGSLAPVKRTLKAIRKKGLHLEITHLVVPGLNDRVEEFTEMTDWVAGELGRDTVLHLSRYFPAWKYDQSPTPVTLLERFYQIAAEKLDYVYMGNISAGSPGSDTKCGRCGTLVIKRRGYKTDLTGLDNDGNCRNCGNNMVALS
ncbi:MAG: AmmeMemoRadiSam system radical SAM enzyme [Bacteroidales bacterium]